MANTTLSAQLQNLRDLGVRAAFTQKHRPSLLFDPKLAGDLDRAALLEIGIEGLSELERIDERFKEFRDTLFSPIAKGVDRYLITKDKEVLVKREIKAFLRLLSPALLCVGSLKALEWLVRRFMIASFDYEEIIGCIIPYHDSVLFVQIIGILTIPQQSKFSFIRRVQKTKLPIPRDSVVKFISSDFSLLEFIFTLAEDARSNNVHNVALNSMIGMVTVQYIELVANIGENHTRSIVSTLSQWQKKPSSLADLDLIHVSFMGLAALSMKVPLNEDTLGRLITIAVLSASDKTIEVTVEYISVIVRSIGPPLQLPLSCIEALLQDKLRDTLLRKYKTTNDPSLLIFILKSVLLYVSRHPPSYAKLEEGILSLISSADSRDLLNGEIANLTASLMTKKNSDSLLGLMSTLSDRTGQSTTADAVIEIPETSTNVHISTIRSIPPSAYASLLKSGNEHVLRVLLNHSSLISESVPPPQLLNLLLDVVFSDLDPKLTIGYHNMLLNIPEESVDVNILAEALAGKLWAQGSKCNYRQISSTISAIQRSKNLQCIFGTLKTAGDAVMLSKNKIPPTFQVSCVTDISGNISAKNSASWINWLNSPHNHSKLLAYAVISVWAESSRLSSQDTNSITTLLNNDPPDQLPCGMALLGENFVVFFSKICRAYNSPTDLLSILKIFLAKTLANSFEKIEPGDGGMCSYLKSSVHNSEKLSMLNSLKIIISTLSPSLVRGDSVDLHSFACDQSLEYFIFLYTEIFETKPASYSCTLQLCISQMRKFIENNRSHDYQLIVPILMSALISESRGLREVAIYTLEVLADIYSKLRENGMAPDSRTIFAYDKLYGQQTKEVFYITYTASQHLISDLVKRRGQILSGPEALVDALRESFSTHEKVWKGEIIPFLCSVSLVIPSYAIRSVLIKALEKVESPKKIKMLLNYLQRIVRAPPSFVPCSILSNEIPNNGASVYNTFEGILNTLHTEAGASVINSSNGNYIRLLVETLMSPYAFTDLCGSPFDLQRLALKTTSPQMFGRLSNINRELIFGTLTDIASCSGSYTSEAAFDAKEVLKKLDLDTNLILSQVDRLLKDLAHAQDMKKRQKSDNCGSEINISNVDAVHSAFKRVISLFELILLKKNSTCGKLELAEPLSELLKVVLNSTQDGMMSFEYLKQLLLSALCHIVKGANWDSLKSEKTSGVRISYIVACIRETQNLQTQNSALLLLSEIAKVRPEEVLLNIMPVFVFIGTNIIRKDDNYNFYVIHRTLETVLPALVSDEISGSSKSNNGNVNHPSMSKVNICINVFAGALPHIPKHRRLRLFTTLVRMLGQNTHLGVVVMHLIRLSLTTKIQSSTEVLDFTKSLFVLFPLRTCLLAILEIVNIASNIPGEASSYAGLCSSLSPEIAHLLFRGSTKRLFRTQLTLFEFVLSVILSTEFADKFLGTDASADACIELQVDLIKTTIDVKCKLSSSIANKLLTRSIGNSLIKITSLQTLQSFLSSVYILLQDEALETVLISNNPISGQGIAGSNNLPNNLQSRYTSLISLLTAKLPHRIESGSISTADVSLIQKLLLRTVELGVTPTNSSNEHTQVAVFGLLSALSNTRSPRTADILSGLASKIVTRAAWNSCDSLFASGMECVSLLCREVHDDCIANITDIAKILEDRVKDKDFLPVAAPILNYYTILVNTAPEFASPYICSMLEVCFEVISRSQIETGENLDFTKLTQCARALLANISQNLRTSSVLGHMYALFRKVVTMNSATFTEYVRYLLYTISSAALAGKLLDHYCDIFKLLLVGSDYRRIYFSKLSPSEISTVESAISASYVALFKELDEKKVSFLFDSLFKWGTSAEGITDSESQFPSLVRRTAFMYYIVSDIIATLGDRFESCALHLLEYANEILLHINHSMKTERQPNTKPNKQLDERNAKTGGLLDNLEYIESSQLIEDLLPSVLGFIRAFFKSPSAEKIIHDTLLSLIERLVSMITLNPIIFECLCTSYAAILKCNITKEYLKLLLSRTRDSNADIRLASIRLLTNTFASLKESLASYVPESVSYISELLDDDNPLIEMASQTLIKTIETSTNCSLEHYF